MDDDDQQDAGRRGEELPDQPGPKPRDGEDIGGDGVTDDAPPPPPPEE